MKHRLHQSVLITLLLTLRAHTIYAEQLPYSANTYFNQAELLRSSGKVHEAIEKYRNAVSVNHEHFEAHFYLANELFKQANFNEAAHHYRKAIGIHNGAVPAYFNLGVCLNIMNLPEEARTPLEQAVSLEPNHLRAHIILGEVLQKLHNTADAKKHFSRALQLDAHNIDAHLGIARTLRAENNFSAASHHYKQVAQAKKNDLAFNFEYAFNFNQGGMYQEAINAYDHCLKIEPNCINALTNKAHALRTIGNMHQALPCYEKLIIAEPHDAHLHYGYAETLLMLGSMPQGWHEFAWRLRRDSDPRSLLTNNWDGSNLQGKRILLRAEYGQGDTFQFIRYAQFLKEQGAIVQLEAQETLITILSLCPYIDEIVPVGAPLPEHDVQLPVMSLPQLFNTSLHTIPQNIPYLYADEHLTEQWGKALAHDNNLKVGICWTASPYYNNFRSSLSQKSMPLGAFEALSQLEGVSLYSLQKMDGEDQLSSLPEGMMVHNFGPNFDLHHGRFMDTAAVMKNLDLIITVDTSVAHLAGALGIPVWVMLPCVADWRWMQDREDSPWYPTMRLFRQQTPGNWDLLMEIVAQELNHYRKHQNNISEIVTAEISVGELIDKITILEIKQKEIRDEKKLHNITNELMALNKTRAAHVPFSPMIEKLKKQLLETNKQLWVIEDAIRDKESEQKFDEEFIQLARSVYFTNDHRCKIKRQINEQVGSRLVEEKSYKDYTTGTSPVLG